MTRWPAAFGVALLTASLFAWAEDEVAAPAPLSAEDVLASSERHFPRVLQSIAARRAAAGDALAAEGAFDLVFGADGFSRLSGFYDGTAIEGTARQRLRSVGASVYAGYKISDGTFPIYEDIHFTNSGGAFKVGVLFALMRDREIDKERFTETDARLELRQSEFDVVLTKVGVQERALVAYWRWVTAGRQLRVYENLLRIAIERQNGLEEQVRRGARAQIFLTENLQNITRRQTLVTSAERDLRIAANALSLYYRDAEGQSLIADADRLPPGAPINEIYALAEPPEVTTSEALARRPELAILRTTIERERNRIALAENNLKPRLDLAMEVQEGLGSIAEGGPSRDSTDTIIGFTFSVPLQRREARGKLDRSRASLAAREYEQRMREEQIALEVRNLLVDLTVSRELLLLAAQEVQQSEIMRASELRRFQSGASDFFLLNIREEIAADARIKLLNAELATRIARANYDAATVDMARLGIRSEN
ncbi:MAG: TolC family protein [Woeseiaceae bacterium]|nr:TolC family protein [Woeseiaceae bacterium]